MGFVESGLGVVSGLADTAGYFAKEAKTFADESPYETIADGAETLEAAYGLYDEGPSVAGVTKLATSGGKLAVDLLGDNAEVEGAESMDPTGIGSMLGGAATAVGGVANMVEHSDQIDQGYLTAGPEGGRNEFWGGAGDATLGALHAGLGFGEAVGLSADTVEAASVLGLPLEALSLPETAAAEAADKTLGAAELGVNALGFGAGIGGDIANAALGLEGEDRYNTYFTAGDAVGLAEHAGYDAIGAALGYMAD